jgi:hypothetical protein
MQLLEVPHPFHNISTIIKDVHGNESKEMLQVFFKRRRQESKQQKRRIKGEKLYDSHENSARAIRCTNRYD